PEHEVADQEAIESSKDQGDVYAPRIQSKSLKGEAHEVEERRDQSETLVYRLKNGIEDQRHGGHTRVRNKTPCDIQPSAKEDFGARRHHYAEQIKGPGYPSPEMRRHFCTPLRHDCCAHIRLSF